MGDDTPGVLSGLIARMGSALGWPVRPSPEKKASTVLAELQALWQPMVAVPRCLSVAKAELDAAAPRKKRGPKAGDSAAWCVIDLDARVLSCESRGLKWDEFEIIEAADASSDAHDRVLLRSANRTRGSSWCCDIVRGPRRRGDERAIYYVDLTFMDVALEPQRGVIPGARARAF